MFVDEVALACLIVVSIRRREEEGEEERRSMYFVLGSSRGVVSSDINRVRDIIRGAIRNVVEGAGRTRTP